MTRMTRATLCAAALTTSGCATPYRKPCTVRVDLTLAERAQADRICREEVGVRVNDNGIPIPPGRAVLGCVDFKTAPTRLVTIQREDILYHEAKHLWDRHCRD